jgi:hypothetical protein
MPNDTGVVTICGYAKTKYEERAEDKRRTRSSSAPATPSRTPKYGKLHKPPSVRSFHERPRNRLQKRNTSILLLPRPTLDLFLLESETYPYKTRPSEFLGVYSTLNSVTLAAFKHGAYTFSREGVLDGSEYLSPTGRIKIISLAVQGVGAKAAGPEQSRNLDGGPVRLDIPHPGAQMKETPSNGNKNLVYLAIRQGPHEASCIGVFVDKSVAWGACLRDKAMCALSFTLRDEEKGIGLNNMPQVTSRLVGSGRHVWHVEEHRIEGPG